LSEYGDFNDVEVKIHPNTEGIANVESNLDRARTFHSDNVEVPGFMKAVNKPLHYAIQVQKTRFRIWVNETKLFDIPRGVNTKDTLNQLFFKMEGSNYKDDEIGYYLTNIKVAAGVPDTRHKLIEEGKFSTTGILFGFRSATIKPESYGVIKDIASVLKENPTVKVKVVGHTSNDGDLNANLELSKQRAVAVKDMMIKEFGIEESRLETEGKGPTQPVADNKPPEGKAQNRRVEFIKL
jgi:outer membrane protein OmpA-like peptidoglycan-associated protein